MRLLRFSKTCSLCSVVLVMYARRLSVRTMPESKYKMTIVLLKTVSNGQHNKIKYDLLKMIARLFQRQNGWNDKRRINSIHVDNRCVSRRVTEPYSICIWAVLCGASRSRYSTWKWYRNRREHPLFYVMFWHCFLEQFTTHTFHVKCNVVAGYPNVSMPLR